jgi:outer membrane protein assembly factor BamB
VDFPGRRRGDRARRDLAQDRRGAHLDGRIFGLNADDGKRKWVFQRASPSLLLRSEAGVLTMGQDVVAGYPNGKLIALDIDDGKLTWETTVSLPRGATELERITDVAGLPLVDGQTVCAAAFQAKVGCFEIATRNVIWSRDLSTAKGLARDERQIYLVDDQSRVHALAKDSGASVWNQDKLKFRKLTAPLVFDRSSGSATTKATCTSSLPRRATSSGASAWTAAPSTPWSPPTAASSSRPPTAPSRWFASDVLKHNTETQRHRGHREMSVNSR